MTTPIRTALLGIHAQTSLHPGAGTALGTVDLPIQRERHTHWPIIPGSAIKGVLRDAYRETHLSTENFDPQEYSFEFERTASGGFQEAGSVRQLKPREMADSKRVLNDLFGPPTAKADEFAGALSLTDARILAFPLRSLRGVFAWISCPAVLERLTRDVRLSGWSGTDLQVPELTDGIYAAPSQCACRLPSGEIVLEDSDFAQAGALADEHSQQVHRAAEWIARTVLPEEPEYAATRKRFVEHFVLLSDNDFTHFVRHATEVSARIALNYETKTVKQGALFYQEFLPAETLLYSVALCNESRIRERRSSSRSPFEEWQASLQNIPYLQFGGDESTGKGWCAIRLTTQEVPRA
ncbi:MAG: type III-B CRISPR module RAMP protein Cmr4 [Planctomycetota bacterium]